MTRGTSSLALTALLLIAFVTAASAYPSHLAAYALMYGGLWMACRESTRRL